MMLELARLMKESVYQPDKTVLFVAWAGGERQEGLSVVNVLNARPGASALNCGDGYRTLRRRLWNGRFDQPGQ